MEKIKTSTRIIFHRILRVTGFLFLFLGILGLIFPVIPGVPLLLLSFIILGEETLVTGWIIKKLPKSIREKVQAQLSRRKIK